MTDKPRISILIPCRDEEKYIGPCLESIISNDFSKKDLEIFVIDGMSKDKTRDIAKKYARTHTYITLLDNQKKITPAALNLGIKEARGDLILWMSAHNTYRENYISTCVEYLSKFKADAVGGVIKVFPREKNSIGISICLASSHPFGVGNSAHKTGVDKAQWADTAFGVCYKKEIFEKIGTFNENLIRGQDMEFSLRMKNAGIRTLIAPDIISHYYIRSDFRSFCKHTLKNGLWAILPLKYSAIMPISIRHLIPLVFVSSLLLLVMVSFFFPFALWLFLSIMGMHAFINIFFSAKLAAKEKDPKYFFILPLIFFTLHTAYGLGSLIGVIRLTFSRQFWKNKIQRERSSTHFQK